MSLDVYLEVARDEKTNAEKAYELLRQNGLDEFANELEARHSDEIGPIRVYDANITHNLNRMADWAGIYKHLWRPDEIGITHAKQLIEPLRVGLEKLRKNQAEAETYNASNGWGMYEHFVPWVASYLAACEEYPDAEISVSR